MMQVDNFRLWDNMKKTELMRLIILENDYFFARRLYVTT